MSHLYHRQLGIIPPDRITDGVTIIGVGSIGSFTALSLAKMGVKKFQLFDDDKIELHNVANQYYRLSDIGKLKVEACRDLLREQSPEPNNLRFHLMSEKFTEESETLYPIIIVCTDNMESRRTAYQHFKDNWNSLLYIDSRMARELLHVFCLTKDKVDRMREYEEVYLSHGNVEVPCTERTVVYNVLLISSLVANLVKKYYMQEELPFHIVYSFKDMYYSVEK